MVMRANSPAPVFSDLPATMVDDIRKIPGTRIVAPEVWKVAPPIEGRNLLAKAATSMLTKKGADRFSAFAETILIEGQQLPEHLNLKSGVFEQALLPPDKGGGRFLRIEDVGQPNVIISTKIARDFPNSDGSPKKVGDSILIGGKKFEVIGMYETGSILIDGTIVMDIETARTLLNVDKNSVSAFYVEPKPLFDLSNLGDQITGKLDDVQIRTMSQFNIQVGDVMGKLEFFLTLTIGLALLVGGVGIANTMLMSAMERIVEFGVMRSNGWTRRNILNLVTVESALLGLLSGIFGSIVAFAGIAAINRFLEGLELRLELTPGLIIASNLTALVIASAAGLYPAWRASRMTPMDAIRNEAS
jgi:putative ABC transport system permease protein